MTMRRISLLIVCLFAMPALASAADTLSDVEKKIDKAWAANKSVNAKVTMTGYQKQQMQTITMTGSGSFEWAKMEGVEKTRMEFKSAATLGSGDDALTIESNSLVISNGKFLYSMLTRGQQTEAYKQKAEDREDMGGGRVIKLLRDQDNVLKLLDNEKLQDHDVYVIRAEPREPDPQSPEQATRIYVDRKTGLVIKRVVLDAEGDAIFTMLLTDIKTDQPVKPDRFVFKAPENVTIKDTTGE